MVTSKPRFSVIIPTRERATTLRHSLATCLHQDFDDYEIVVADNHSSPATREVVDDFGSSRIRYVRAHRPLSMSSNWEMAVSQAVGEYIVVLGDDDGLLPFALSELDRLAEQSASGIVRWSAALYLWPDLVFPEDANYLRLPLSTRPPEMVNSTDAIADVIAFRRPYVSLPMLYNSAVHRSVIDTVRQRAGRLFPSVYPDVFSGFAIAHVGGEYLSTDIPMGVAGSSGASFGIATLFLRDRSPLDAELRRLNRDDGRHHHPAVPDLPVFPFVPVAEAFLVAKERLFPDEDGLALDRRQLVQHYMHHLATDSDAKWKTALETIRASCYDDSELLAWFDATCGSWSRPEVERIRLRSATLGFDGEFLHLDTGAFGVDDIRGATQLCALLLGRVP